MKQVREVLLGPVRQAGATEQVARRLGEAIGSGVLKPGERLPPEDELAKLLEVAPMTLRQALAALREAGYITTVRGRLGGSFVADRPLEASPLWGQTAPSARKLRDLTDWRRAVSGEASSLAAARIDAAGSARLADLFRAAGSCVHDQHDYRLADSAFHVAIADLSGSARLIAAEAQIQVELTELLHTIPRPPAALEASNAQHTPILTSITAGDADSARTHAIEHVEATYEWFIGLSLGQIRDGD